MGTQWRAELLTLSLIIFQVSYLRDTYISKANLVYAIQDYIEAKNQHSQEKGLMWLLEKDPSRFVGKGKLAKKFKPYVLPFLTNRRF